MLCASTILKYFIWLGHLLGNCMKAIKDGNWGVSQVTICLMTLIVETLTSQGQCTSAKYPFIPCEAVTLYPWVVMWQFDSVTIVIWVVAICVNWCVCCTSLGKLSVILQQGLVSGDFEVCFSPKRSQAILWHHSTILYYVSAFVWHLLETHQNVLRLRYTLLAICC